MKTSALQQARYSYNPKLPLILREDISKIRPVLGQKTQSVFLPSVRHLSSSRLSSACS